MKVKSKACILVLLAVILLLAVAFIHSRTEQKQAATADLFYQALTETEKIESYRYTLEAGLSLKNGSIARTALSGAKDRYGNLHILGRLVDTDLEAYQIGNTHYRFRSVDKTWEKQENSPLPDNPLLITLIDPLVNLKFTDTVAVTFTEKVKINGKKRVRFKVIPKQGYHIADSFYTDFCCLAAVDEKTGYITDAVISAVSRTESESKLKINVHFFDINEDFTVSPPGN